MKKKNASSSTTTAKRRGKKSSHGVQGGSPAANRQAIVILEVLAGARTPADAAAALEISLPRYYQLETRALEGLVAACEPRKKGRQASPQTQLDRLQRELEQARRECSRQQALVRAAGRALGVKAPDAASRGGKTKKASRSRTGKRPRRPTARALKAVAALRENDRESEPQSVQPTDTEASPETVSTATRQA